METTPTNNYIHLLSSAITAKLDRLTNAVLIDPKSCDHFSSQEIRQTIDILLLYSAYRPLTVYVHRNLTLVNFDARSGQETFESKLVKAKNTLHRIHLAKLRLPSSKKQLSTKSYKLAHTEIIPENEGSLRQHNLEISNRLRPDSSLIAVPPDKIVLYLNNLSQFIKTQRASWWVLASIFFAQLIQIHPFSDGNSRLSKAVLLWLCKHVDGSSLALSLLFIFHVITGRECLFPSLKFMRDGNLNPYTEYIIYSAEWVHQTLYELQARKLDIKDASLSSLADSLVVDILTNDYEGKTY